MVKEKVWSVCEFKGLLQRERGNDSKGNSSQRKPYNPGHGTELI